MPDRTRTGLAPAPVPLRELKYRRTERRIERVALRLFRERGFQDVRVADICREAGVGPATFYRHFGTKEGVVFAYRDDFLTALRDAIHTADGDLPGPQQLSGILDTFACFLECQRDLLALRDEIVLVNATLMRRTLEMQREMEAELARGLADLRRLDHPDGTAQLQAAVGMVVLRLAVRSWRGGHSTSLPAAVRRLLVDVGTAVGALPVDHRDGLAGH